MKGPDLVRAFFYLWASIVIYPDGSKAVEDVNDTFTLCDFPGFALTSLAFTILTKNLFRAMGTFHLNKNAKVSFYN